MVIDCDQHLFEYRGLWADHIDPALRDEAIRFVDDARGHTWVMWRERKLALADVSFPGETDAIGRRFARARADLAPEGRYDELLPPDYWDPAARVTKLGEIGVEQAVVFPNYGLVWERTLGCSLPALTANMSAWNRWCAAIVKQGGGKLHPVAHLTLRDLDWLEGELRHLETSGVRLAMIAPALVDGRQLSHPDLDRAWSAFARHGVSPVFHVADQQRVFDDAWYTDGGELGVPVVSSVFLWTAAALAATDLIVNGVLDRHPDLRLGIVELSAIWVPLYLRMLDGGWAFVRRLNGRSPAELALQPSEYFRRQVRVASFAYELPARLTRDSGDLFMCCSDYPHSEGTAHPLDDYRAPGKHGVDPASAPGLFGGNLAFLLRS